MKPETIKKLIIDTDPGHDDALAILMLLKSKQFEIQAITTVAGNSPIENVTRNAQAMLDVVGCEAPVFSGLPNPLKRKLVTAVVHGSDGLAGFDTSQTCFRLTGDAPEKIVEIVRKFPGQVTILAIGPLSNIARALQIEPKLPELVAEIVIMGGAIDVPGNKSRVAEFNFFVDPEAADIVFKSSLQRTLVPLDLCMQTVLQLEDFRAVKDERLRGLLTPMMDHFIEGLREDEGTNGILAYDALAAYVLLNRGAFGFAPMNIQIETKGEHTAGMSVAERRPYKQMTPNTQVAVNVDQTRFRQGFFGTLSA